MRHHVSWTPAGPRPPARGLSWFVFALVAGWTHQGLAQWMTQTNVTFTLPNSVLGAYTVQYSTNLVNWQSLGPASPRYLLTDSQTTNRPRRFYRVRSP